MKQILQDMSGGSTYLAEAPAPIARKGALLIATRISLISTGTERMLVDFGRASMLQKARQQPERVKMVLDKVKTDGLLPTIDAVRSKLNQPLPLGYCNVGTVMETGGDCEGYSVGDRVVSNGPHADIVCVPKNLCARIPDNVSDEAASFTILGAIGLQGIRLAESTLGEAFVVVGVGLIGLLTVQLLLAQGCRVLAVDFDPAKLQLAARFGAETCNPAEGEDPVAAGMAFSRGRGVDGVIITASTSSSDPVTQAARMSRKRGRIVLVGVTGLELNRADFYEKELSFQVSCSYGPGRYDSGYELQGHDYPVGFVRWTEQRNFEAVLDMMASGRLDVEPLISKRIAFEEAPSAYDLLTSDKSALGVLLTYAAQQEAVLRETRVPLSDKMPVFSADRAVCGFIGGGNYASRVLIPAFKKGGAQLHTIVTSGGTNSGIQGRQAGFAQAASDAEAILSDPAINTVAVATRHDTHADYVIRALRARKNIFVEKPLALTNEEIDAVETAYAEAAGGQNAPRLMVGFNRRFAPHVIKMRELLAPVSEPKSFILTMNAGAIPADHWTQDISAGGGRIIGEACHYIDLMRFLAGSPIVSVMARRMGNAPGVAITEDKAVIVLGFADGSFGTVNYFANGAKSFPKERVEVFCAGRTLQLDNFRKLTGFGWPGFKRMGGWSQDKGQDACAAAFLNAITEGKASPIPAAEIFEVARATVEAARILRQQP
ncbi:bi-domain-containing oxidoreductase [Phyllobacterium leguminum]|uniref:Putative dehydrogenase n=1 Tax=Phyllobacterium leguminum TaxID=314237 RepID=A0A318T505_9HYPH|nr:bi-domain-containing oxidoreductase [Phyllobacterium leguminum]PYE87294.1 putative dehydrogenase [Phyllobacterium leguminum]